MLTDLDILGNPRQLSNARTGHNTANALTVDLPNGPTRNNVVWIIDSVSLVYASDADAGQSLIGSGISIVPLGTPPVHDTVHNFDAFDRGVMIANEIDLQSVGAAPYQADSFVCHSAQAIVPYGYTIRGILATDPNALANVPNGTATLSAIIREIEICDLCS